MWLARATWLSTSLIMSLGLILEHRHGGSATMNEWNKFKARNTEAKLVCIDIQPNTTTQAHDRADILNVGGFSVTKCSM